jgi:hypothetical protein
MKLGKINRVLGWFGLSLCVTAYYVYNPRLGIPDWRSTGLTLEKVKKRKKKPARRAGRA